jgi:hypothetical protein
MAAFSRTRVAFTEAVAYGVGGLVGDIEEALQLLAQQLEPQLLLQTHLSHIRTPPGAHLKSPDLRLLVRNEIAIFISFSEVCQMTIT